MGHCRACGGSVLKVCRWPGHLAETCLWHPCHGSQRSTIQERLYASGTLATVFGPSDRVLGGMIVVQDGKLKDVVNVQHIELNAKELVFGKAHMEESGSPVAPCVPPPSDDWDASKVFILSGQENTFDGQRLLPATEEHEAPGEAPLVEDVPECPRVRGEELVDEPMLAWTEPFTPTDQAQAEEEETEHAMRSGTVAGS